MSEPMLTPPSATSSSAASEPLDEKVQRLQLAWENKYIGWVASKQRHDRALEEYHHAFTYLLRAKVEQAKAARLADEEEAQ